MTRLHATALLVVALLLSAGAWAHDARLHQTNATTGDIISIGNDTFDLKTAKGNVKVTYSSKTKFEHAGAAVDKSHLKKGDQVGVIGTKLPTGELVAREVLLGLAEPPKGGKAKAAEHKH